MHSLDELLAELTGGDEESAEAAAFGLAQFGQKAIPALELLAISSVADHRWWAIRILAQMEAPPVDWFIQGLADMSEEVQEAAALAIAAHPTEKAIPELIRVLSEADGVLGTLVVKALVAIGKTSVPGLLDAYQKARQQSRILIMRSLAEIRDPRAIALMLKATEDGSAMLNYWAQEGLERLGLNMVYIKPE